MNAPLNIPSVIGVYQAINKVQADLATVGISKDRTNTQGSGYKFRGIDDVYNTLSRLLATHSLCILPRMVSRTCEERQSKSGGALFYVTVEAEFDFVSAIDGSTHTVRTFGEAMDSGDKATNKAMSAAYKYAAFQAFAIPTQGDNDADAQTHEVKAKAAPQKPASVARVEFDKLPEDEQQFLRDLAIEVIGAKSISAMYDAYQKAKASLDADEQVAFWSLFDSKQRSAIKAEGVMRENAAKTKPTLAEAM